MIFIVNFHLLEIDKLNIFHVHVSILKSDKNFALYTLCYKCIHPKYYSWKVTTIVNHAYFDLWITEERLAYAVIYPPPKMISYIAASYTRLITIGKVISGVKFCDSVIFFITCTIKHFYSMGMTIPKVILSMRCFSGLLKKITISTMSRHFLKLMHNNIILNKKCKSLYTASVYIHEQCSACKMTGEKLLPITLQLISQILV